MGFSRQECCSGLPGIHLGDLPNPGMEPRSPAWADRFFTTSATWEASAKEQKELLEVVKIWLVLTHLSIQRVTGKCLQYTSVLVQISRKLTRG